MIAVLQISALTGAPLQDSELDERHSDGIGE
jgi:hypothetical protein